MRSVAATERSRARCGIRCSAIVAIDEVPITSVTNGVHVPTWLAPPMRSLLDAHLGEDWLARADDPATWEAVDDISDEDLWRARCECRRILIDRTREKATQDRLRRGEDITYVEAAQAGFDPDRLTIGFARRLATYKRLYLLALRPERALGLLGGQHPLQFSSPGRLIPSTMAPRRSSAISSTSRARPRSRIGSRSSRTTTFRSRGLSWPGATCGSTCLDRRRRRVARAG